MHILLLCQGDPAARDLLKRTIMARYGSSPLAIESLQVQFSGRSRVKLGPVKTWVPTASRAFFRFPSHLRWDFIVKPVGLPIQRGSEAFDGVYYHSVRRGSPATAVDDVAMVASIRRRLWAMAALLLTPLSDDGVQVSLTDSGAIEAENTRLGDAVRLHLRPDHSLEAVSVRCLNPDTEHEQLFRIVLSEELAPINGLMLPKKISLFWDDEPTYEAVATAAHLNPPLADDVFTLDAASNGE